MKRKCIKEKDVNKEVTSSVEKNKWKIRYKGKCIKSWQRLCFSVTIWGTILMRVHFINEIGQGKSQLVLWLAKHTDLFLKWWLRIWPKLCQTKSANLLIKALYPMLIIAIILVDLWTLTV